MIRGNMSSPDEPTVQSMSGTQLPLPWALLRRGRQLYGLYFFLGGFFKVLIGLLWSDILKSMFLERLLDIPAETFAHEYLTSFAIPNAFFVAYVLTLGELCVGLLFMLNVFAKWGAVLAIFITINIGLGGFFSWILVGFILFPFVVIFFEHPENHPHFQVEGSTQGDIHDRQ
jgi:uncharacterized membrane protein YphA (DoxX/SURF4 family)